MLIVTLEHLMLIIIIVLGTVSIAVLIIMVIVGLREGYFWFSNDQQQ